MTNSVKKKTIHYGDPATSALPWCNTVGGTKLMKPQEVTCKRCLATLKKRWGFVPEVTK